MPGVSLELLHCILKRKENNKNLQFCKSFALGYIFQENDEQRDVKSSEFLKSLRLSFDPEPYIWHHNL